MNGRMARAVRQRLESLAAAGVTSLPWAEPRQDSQGEPATRDEGIPAQPAGENAAQPAGQASRPNDLPADLAARESVPAADAAGRGRSLALLKQRVIDCTRCTELAAQRTQTVFGSGPPDARLCFFGEAPGADEDASGEPFVGRAGQLLTKIIEACQLRREDVYIMNVLKCRPPGNRQPLPDEVANCRPFFEGQFGAIAPEFICCLGTTAARALLQTGEPIGKLRRRWFDHVIRRPEGDVTARVLCTYHPSYLLRNPAAKRDVWEDMKMLMRAMGIPAD
jgi:uracil-DNA glycosylase family 4